MSMDDTWEEEISESDNRKISRNDHYHLEKPAMIRWRSGKEVEDKLMVVLHSFRELYIKRGEFFKKIFPGLLHDAFADVFKKIDAVVKKKDQIKMQTLQRSSSFGSPWGLQQNDIETELRLQRFKVRTPAAGQGGKGGQGGGKISKSP